jgi:hypothetical protein
METRKAAFSGSWYPAGASECERQIKGFLDETGVEEIGDGKFKGGIVPHAGWYFSGAIACHVIQRLLQDPQPEVMLIFGMHLHSKSPCYIMDRGAWETPFGDIAVHTDLACDLAAHFPFQLETADNCHPDNTIELQLPFLKYFCPDIKIVPMGVPPAKIALDIGRTAARLATDRGVAVRVLGSTDLTHYGSNYGFTPQGIGPGAVDWAKNQNDRRIIDTILVMDPEAVIKQSRQHQNTCCAGAVAAAITAARQLGAEKGIQLAYASSYDKSPGDSFVGYTGILF